MNWGGGINFCFHGYAGGCSICDSSGWHVRYFPTMEEDVGVIKNEGPTFADALARVKDLEQQLEDAKDARRMDWLEKHSSILFGCLLAKQKSGRWGAGIDAPTLREAIDAAMEAEKNG